MPDHSMASEPDREDADADAPGNVEGDGKVQDLAKAGRKDFNPNEGAD